jgi:ParB family chromosome partitioning protein
MQVLISAIQIPDRVRKDLGDLQPLTDSLQRCGQLNPITVTREMVLVAGHRRCEAASRLGWRMIDATVVDGINEIRRLEIELEENLHRKDFSPEELLEGVRRLEALRHPSPMQRLRGAVRKVVSALAFWRYFGARRKAREGESQSGLPGGPASQAVRLDPPAPDTAPAAPNSRFRGLRGRGGAVRGDADGEEALGI